MAGPAADRARLVPPARAGRIRPPAGRGEGGAELAGVLRRVFQQSLQRAHADHDRQREEPRAVVDVSGGGRRRLADHAARRRRHHVSHAAAERRGRARRQDGPRLLDLPAPADARPDRLLRREQPRPGDSGRHAVHGDARRAPRGHQREERPADLEYAGGGEQGRLLTDAGAARRQGQDHRRRRRRRVRHPRLRRRVRRANRPGSLALLHDSRAGRTGRRQLEAVSRGCHYLLRSRGVEARRRLGVGDGLVRCQPQPDVLGCRQRRP